MKLIAFEGIDASGKETQVQNLVNSLLGKGFRVATETFPRYDKPIGYLIGKALRGEITLSPEAMHMLMQVDVQDYSDRLEGMKKDGVDFVVVDRWTLSNKAYCMAKGINFDWVQDIQSKIWQPDLTFVLDISAETSMKRKGKVKDLHELDGSLLNRARMAYNVLAEKLSDIRYGDELIYVIDGNGTPEEIHEDVWNIVNNLFFIGGEDKRL